MAAVLFAALLISLGLVPELQNVTRPVTAVPAPEDTLRQLGFAFVDPNQYLLPFELASVLLLVALIGSIVIAADRKSP
jgi:NADH-quinone oxidoreductase subunit J